MDIRMRRRTGASRHFWSTRFSKNQPSAVSLRPIDGLPGRSSLTIHARQKLAERVAGVGRRLSWVTARGLRSCGCGTHGRAHSRSRWQVPGDPHPLTRVAHELNGALSVTDRHLSWCSRAPAVRAPRFELIGKVRVHGGNSCRWEPDRGSASRSPLFQTRHGCGLDTATATLLSKVDVAVLPQEPHAPTSGLRPYEE